MWYLAIDSAEHFFSLPQSIDDNGCYFSVRFAFFIYILFFEYVFAVLLFFSRQVFFVDDLFAANTNSGEEKSNFCRWMWFGVIDGIFKFQELLNDTSLKLIFAAYAHPNFRVQTSSKWF